MDAAASNQAADLVTSGFADYQKKRGLVGASGWCVRVLIMQRPQLTAHFDATPGVLALRAVKPYRNGEVKKNAYPSRRKHRDRFDIKADEAEFDIGYYHSILSGVRCITKTRS